MPYRSQMISQNSQTVPYERNNIRIHRSTSSLLLGVVSAAVAFPVVVLAISLSVFLPQEKWEEFWDKFIEM